MKHVFTNPSNVTCIFTEEGITFYGPEQDIYLPYGCIDELKMSLMGVLQTTCGSTACSFAVQHGDRAQVKELVKQGKAAMKQAPAADLLRYDHKKEHGISRTLPPEEQLHAYKELFIQGGISKDVYDMEKRLLKP